MEKNSKKKSQKIISRVSLSGCQSISKKEEHKAAITQEKENKTCRPNPSRSEKLNSSYLNSQNSWNGLQRSLLHLCMLERFFPSLAAKAEGREDTVSFAGNTRLCRAFLYSASCLSLKMMGTSTEVLLTSKHLTVVTPTNKYILVWVPTFVP